MWSDGFDITVYLRDTSEVFAVSGLALTAPIAMTLPGSVAQDRFGEEFAGSAVLESVPLSTVQSGFQLTICTFNDPQEEQLAELVADLRGFKSVLAVTDNRCTDNATPQPIDG